MSLIECHFQSNGAICVGDLMLPDGVENPPVIVMAHGFASIRQARLPSFAERFTEAGYAAFLFDYRTFGDSEGEPRHWVHPGRQIQDWEAAIEYVRTRPEVDSQRIVLWGTSYSGGYVLQLAAQHEEVTAVISQLPHVSGPATIAKSHPWTLIKCTLAAVLDTAAGLVNRTFYTPIVGTPGSRAAVTGDTANEAYRRMLPENIVWNNRVLSRSFLQIPLYIPRRHVHRISAPALVIAAARDSVVSSSATRRAARRILNGTFRVIDGDHFEPYFGACFEENIALQLAFLREHVPVE